jgi:hypothetical protein
LRSGTLQSLGRTQAPVFATVPALRSGMKNAAPRPGHAAKLIDSLQIRYKT